MWKIPICAAGFCGFWLFLWKAQWQKSLLGSEEDYTAQGLCQQPQAGTRNAGSQLCTPCPLPASSSTGRVDGATAIPLPSHSRPLEQGREQGRAEGDTLCNKLSPLLLPTSGSRSFPLLYGHNRFPGGLPKPSLELLSSGRGELTSGPAGSAPWAGGAQHVLPTALSTFSLLLINSSSGPALFGETSQIQRGTTTSAPVQCPGTEW